MTLTIQHRLPTVKEFRTLRAETTWGVPDRAATEKVLKHSFSGVVMHNNDELIGMARTVGDGCLILYIQDVIIAADYRAKGVGRRILAALLDDASERCLPSCTIGLFAAIDQEGFYKKLGFNTRGNPTYGPGMHGTLSTLAKTNSAA